MPAKPKWDEIACPECKEPVAWNATRCPKCQAIYTRSQIQARERTHDSNQKFGLGCLAVIGVFVLGMCAVSGDDTSASNSIGNQDATIPAIGKSSADVKAGVKGFHSEIMAGVEECDVAGKALAARADGFSDGSTSVYDGYRLAARMEEACRSSWRKVSQIEVPSSLTGVAHDQAEKTVETCENAMLAKQMSAASMKDVLDGNMRPSKLADVQQKSELAQAGTIACVAGIFDVGLKAGVDVSEFVK